MTSNGVARHIGRAKGRPHSLLASVALSLLLANGIVVRAWADGGNGGASGAFPGGAGGAGSSGAAGGDGTINTGNTIGVPTGGGGGGGAAGGGAGGNGAGDGGGAGGAGGTAASPNGADGTAGLTSGGGGGGGGGFNGLAPGIGGTGGDSGNIVVGNNGIFTGGGGGGGGAGGNGLGLGTGPSGGLGGGGSNVTGGTGAAGATVTATITGGNGGNGGDGGIGNSQSGNFNFLTNSTGGAGRNGGFSGSSSVHVTAVDAGATANANANGGNAGNGGNGGAGFSAAGTTVLNGAAATGGDGGGGRAGGNAQARADATAAGGAANAVAKGGNGGSGGNGGAGAVLTAAGVSFTNSGTITGGDGGFGGSGGVPSTIVNSGGGGSSTGATLGARGAAGVGGAGVQFLGGGATFINTGIVRGGDGASGAGGGSAGGVGVIGSGLTIVNSGSIRGGFDLGHTFQQLAIVLTGGANAIGPGGAINGGIQLQAGSLMPALPGSAIGPTLAVNGPVSLAPGTTFNNRVSGAATDSITTAQGDASSSTATVAGAGVLTTAQNYILNQRYTIITAGSISGTFASIASNADSAFVKAQLSYDATHVYETFVGNGPNGGVNYTAAALTQNQINVSSALTTAGQPRGFTGPILDFLNGLSSAQARAAFDVLDGELGSSVQQTTYNAMNLFVGLITDPFIGGRANPTAAGVGPTAFAGERSAFASRSRSEREAYAAVYGKAPPMAPRFEERWSVWAAGFGGSQTTSGDPVVVGTHDTRSSVYGVAVGADYRFTPDTLAGFAIAGGGTNFSVANNLGTGRSDLFQAGAFVRHNMGPAYVTSALAFGWQDVTTDRTLTLIGLDRLRAQFNAEAYTGRIEAGYRYLLGGFGLTPYGAAQITAIDLPAYGEQAIAGANTFALNYSSKGASDTRSEVGVRADKSFGWRDGVLTLRGRLAWAHDFNPSRAIQPTFQTLPGASFVVNGAAQAFDSALTTASAEMKWMNGWSAAATFEGEFSSVTRSYAGKGVVRYQW